MVDQTDPSTWVYDPRYDNAEEWNREQDEDLNPSSGARSAGESHRPRVTSSRDAWMRSVHSPNAGLILHAQKFWVHDASESRVDEGGHMTVTCTCGLVVSMDNGEDISTRSASYQSKYFAGNHNKSIEWQREFFEHPGHRDPFHNTVLGGFLTRIRPQGVDQPIELELRCNACGLLPLGHTLSGDWANFDTYAHRFPIDMHNIYCPQPGTDFWDGDIYLWGHGPGAAYRARQAERDGDKTANPEADVQQSE